MAPLESNSLYIGTFWIDHRGDEVPHSVDLPLNAMMLFAKSSCCDNSTRISYLADSGQINFTERKLLIIKNGAKLRFNGVIEYLFSCESVIGASEMHIFEVLRIDNQEGK